MDIPVGVAQSRMPDGTLISDYTQWVVIKDLTNNRLMIADYDHRLNYLTIDLNPVFADGKPSAKLVTDLPYPKAVAGPEALRRSGQQLTFAPQAAGSTSSARRPPIGAEPSVNVAAIEAGEFDDDRQPEPRTGLGLVKPPAPPRHLLALGRRQARGRRRRR